MSTADTNRDGFSTKIWGPAAWHFLRCMSFNYPVDERLTEDNKLHYKMFIDSFGHVLPCGSCRKNYQRNLQCAGYGPRVFDSRHNFSRFVYRLEKCVHVMVHPDGISFPSFERRQAMYELFRAKCNDHTGGKEKGCITSRKYVPSQVVLRAVPLKEQKKTFKISKKCLEKL